MDLENFEVVYGYRRGKSNLRRVPELPVSIIRVFGKRIVLPQLKMEFVSGRLGGSLTGDSTHEFPPSSPST